MRLRGAYTLVLIGACLLAGFIAVSAVGWWFSKDEVVAWREDLGAAQQEAAGSGKGVFVDFTAQWDGSCQEMRETTWANQHVADTLAKGYVPVKVDVDQQPVMARKYEVQGVPMLVVLDGEGRVVKSWSGEIGAKAFLDWLKK